jgi:hypothetical protein
VHGRGGARDDGAEVDGDAVGKQVRSRK